MNQIIIGAKYFIQDKITDEVIEAQILSEFLDEYSIKNLSTNEEFLRLKSEFAIKTVINEEEAKRLNNQKLFSVQNELIRAIVGRKEIEDLSENDFEDLNKDNETVLISIIDPGSDHLPNHIKHSFKETLTLDFWDTEESAGTYSTISSEQAKDLKAFILKNKKNSFVIHCEAGISRSAGAGLAIECLCNYDGNKFYHSTGASDIRDHHRYYPNLVVYDKILEA